MVIEMESKITKKNQEPNRKKKCHPTLPYYTNPISTNEIKLENEIPKPIAKVLFFVS